MAAVQGDVPKAGLDFNAQRRAVLDNHVPPPCRSRTHVRAGRTPAPDLVVWPENSSDIDPLRNPDAYAEIGRAADAVGVPLLVGAVLQGPGDDVSNAAIVWGPSASPAAGPGERYVKRHPVPFAEYIPYRSFFRPFSDKVDLVSRDFAAGDRVGCCTLGPGPGRRRHLLRGGLRRHRPRHRRAAGADLLVVQTNNATFGYTDESTQQLAMSRLRAVEAGRAVVHISTVGRERPGASPTARVVDGSAALHPRRADRPSSRCARASRWRPGSARSPRSPSRRSVPLLVGAGRVAQPPAAACRVRGSRERRPRRARGQRRRRYRAAERIRAVPAGRRARRAPATLAGRPRSSRSSRSSSRSSSRTGSAAGARLARAARVPGGLWLLRARAGSGAPRQLGRLRAPTRGAPAR